MGTCALPFCLFLYCHLPFSHLPFYLPFLDLPAVSAGWNSAPACRFCLRSGSPQVGCAGPAVLDWMGVPATCVLRFYRSHPPFLPACYRLFYRSYVLHSAVSAAASRVYRFLPPPRSAVSCFRPLAVSGITVGSGVLCRFADRFTVYRLQIRFYLQISAYSFCVSFLPFTTACFTACRCSFCVLRVSAVLLTVLRVSAVPVAFLDSACRACLPTCRCLLLPAWTLGSLPFCLLLPGWVLVSCCLPACLPPACLPAACLVCLPAVLPAGLPAGLPASFNACLPACLPSLPGLPLLRVPLPAGYLPVTGACRASCRLRCVSACLPRALASLNTCLPVACLGSWVQILGAACVLQNVSGWHACRFLDAVLVAPPLPFVRCLPFCGWMPFLPVCLVSGSALLVPAWVPPFWNLPACVTAVEFRSTCLGGAVRSLHLNYWSTWSAAWIVLAYLEFSAAWVRLYGLHLPACVTARSACRLPALLLRLDAGTLGFSPAIWVPQHHGFCCISYLPLPTRLPPYGLVRLPHRRFPAAWISGCLLPAFLQRRLVLPFSGLPLPHAQNAAYPRICLWFLPPDLVSAVSACLRSPRAFCCARKRAPACWIAPASTPQVVRLPCRRLPNRLRRANARITCLPYLGFYTPPLPCLDCRTAAHAPCLRVCTRG